MIAAPWFALLLRNRFAVHLIRWPMCLAVSYLALFNSCLAILQVALLGRKIARTPIKEDPLFIIGHWRSGTTLLHEMLVLDQRHTYPNTYECFTPAHFLLSASVLAPALRFLLPARRPIDNIAVAWDRPQEDEFALCNLGVPSPYLKMVFPNRPNPDDDYLDFAGLPPEAIERWKSKFRRFVQCITLHRAKRAVFKSPPHTARIKVLCEIFPDARFVHIVRDPYVVFPSTVRLWKRLRRDQALQVPDFQGLDEEVFATLVRMYRAFEAQRPQLAANRYCEVRYEDLIEDPVGQLRTIYERLELDGFETVRPALEEFVAGQKGYQTNKYQLSPEQRAEIARRWGFFFEQYGYEK
jgi:hypothetical protein